VNPVIVVATYNRLNSLDRLLKSLCSAVYRNQDVTLIVSVDKHPDLEGEIIEYLADFKWPHGEFLIKTYTNRLGLKEHFLRCCDFALSFGSVVFLEDDFVVSPWFYRYAESVLAFYSGDPRVAGHSLYSIRINEFANRKFQPRNDGFGEFFVQIPSWGKCFTSDQWQQFRDWYDQVDSNDHEELLPAVARKWGTSSFKREYIKYLAATNRFIAYPRDGLVTNFGLEGTHYTVSDSTVQIPILMPNKSADEIKFSHGEFDRSAAVYDTYMEPLPSILAADCGFLEDIDFVVDLYGIKPRSKMDKEYVLTSKIAKVALLSFGRTLIPHEMNIVSSVEGTHFRLARVEDLGGRRKSLALYLSDASYDLGYASPLKILLVDVMKIVKRALSLLNFR